MIMMTTSVTDLVSEFANNLEKKQRNLLKRKTKLDAYRDILRKGEVLNPDQEKAVSEYDAVYHSIIAIKEMVDGLSELQIKITNSVKITDSVIECNKEKYAIDTLSLLGPFLNLLSKIHYPQVKAAIIKATSHQQYLICTHLAKITSMPMCENMASVSSVKELDSIILSENAYKEQSTILLNLAYGRNSLIPNLKLGKTKPISFADARNLFVNILCDNSVSTSLSMPISNYSSNKKKSVTKEVETINVSELSEKKVVVSPEPIINNFMPPTQQSEISQDPKPVRQNENVLSNVISSTKTIFNFLQESHVSSLPMPSKIREHNIANHHKAVDNLEVNLNHVHIPDQSDQSIKPNETQSTASEPKLPILKEQTFVKTENKLTNGHISDVADNKKEKSKDVPKKQKTKRPKSIRIEQPQTNSIINNEVQECKETVKSKTWADRCRGEFDTIKLQQPLNQSSNGRPIKDLSKNDLKNVEHDEHQRRDRQFNHEDSNRPSFRGNRGRGNGGPFRGFRGRGRGNFRATFRPDQSRGDIQNNRMAPIQSTC